MDFKERRDTYDSVSLQSSGCLLAAPGYDTMDTVGFIEQENIRGCSSFFLTCLNLMKRDDLVDELAVILHNLLQHSLNYFTTFPINFSDPLHKGQSVLSCAAKFNRVKCVKYLLEQPFCDPNHQAEKLYTPLHFAAYFGHSNVVLELLNSGADVTLVNTNGETPYDAALSNRKLECADILQTFRKSSSLNYFVLNAEFRGGLHMEPLRLPLRLPLAQYDG